MLSPNQVPINIFEQLVISKSEPCLDTVLNYLNQDLLLALKKRAPTLKLTTKSCYCNTVYLFYTAHSEKDCIDDQEKRELLVLRG